MELNDVIIIGGGAAGLNAAVVLGRCRRKVILFDAGKQRNLSSHGMHNYLTRDDILPAEFIKVSHSELKKYGVKLINRTIVSALKNNEGIFVAKDNKGTVYHAKKLLIATGLTDKIPEVPGFKEMYGTSVFHCPYCDGWEVRDKKLGVYAKNKEGWELALNLKGWSADVTLYTDGKKNVKPSQKEILDANNIEVVSLPLSKLEAKKGKLHKIIFKNGEEAFCDAMFFVNGYVQHCDLPKTFGCLMSKKGVVVANKVQQTNIPGLYVAGDASRDMHFVVVAAAEGAKAGVTINKELQQELNTVE
jgi:thioredoxin reductase